MKAGPSLLAPLLFLLPMTVGWLHFDVGVWGDPPWPTTSNLRRGRQVAMSTQSAIVERATVANQHAAPGTVAVNARGAGAIAWRLRRADLITQKSEISQILDRAYFADPGLADGSGHFTTWFSTNQDEEITGIRLNPTNILVNAGAPTNWFTSTPWRKLLTHTNGYGPMTSILNQIRWVMDEADWDATGSTRYAVSAIDISTPPAWTSVNHFAVDATNVFAQLTNETAFGVATSALNNSGSWLNTGDVCALFSGGDSHDPCRIFTAWETPQDTTNFGGLLVARRGTLIPQATVADMTLTADLYWRSSSNDTDSGVDNLLASDDDGGDCVRAQAGAITEFDLYGSTQYPAFYSLHASTNILQGDDEIGIYPGHPNGHYGNTISNRFAASDAPTNEPNAAGADWDTADYETRGWVLRMWHILKYDEGTNALAFGP